MYFKKVLIRDLIQYEFCGPEERLFYKYLKSEIETSFSTDPHLNNTRSNLLYADIIAQRGHEQKTYCENTEFWTFGEKTSTFKKKFFKS